jgi:hypothetical protein
MGAGGGTATGGGAGGGFGGGTATGGGVGGGGGTTGTCPATLQCIDGSGAGDYGCFTSSAAFPSNADLCFSSYDCATGFTCWFASIFSLTGRCIQDC